jgi:DNA-binding PadR family transcriptional regulator
MSRNDESALVPTELEAAVLGDVWKNGPCTAYSIRQNFLRSPSPRWSGSAGAIYPLIRRLEDQGLVRSKPNARGKRKQKDYQLTRKGRNVFRRWVRQPTPDFGNGLLHDPLRTKIFFLDVLTNAQAMSLVNNALDAIRNQLSLLERDCDNSHEEENRTTYFAARNAILITEARISWLEEVLQGLDES